METTLPQAVSEAAAISKRVSFEILFIFFSFCAEAELNVSALFCCHNKQSDRDINVLHSDKYIIILTKFFLYLYISTFF